ncbi:MAG: Na+ dependent nucleoside transporter N-terminal domain-containing protein, partial [Burkholderiales bacterium]
MISFLQPVVGYAALIAIAWILSARRAAIPWRTVIGGVGLQVVLAVLIHRVPLAQSVILALNRAMLALE